MKNMQSFIIFCITVLLLAFFLFGLFFFSDVLLKLAGLGN